MFDNYPQQIGWSITEDNDKYQLSVFPGSYLPGTPAVQEEITLPAGNNYTFLIYDTEHNGLCCPYPGTFILEYKGPPVVILAEGGGNFTELETNFSIPETM